MYTVEYIVAEFPYKDKRERVELIKAYAIQVAESVRDEILYCVDSGMNRQEIIDKFYNSTFEKFIK